MITGELKNKVEKIWEISDFIIKENRRIGVKTKTPSGIKEYKGKIIIIADGMSSKLAVKSGLREKWKTEEVMLTKCAILEGENNIDKDTISLFFKSYKRLQTLAHYLIKTSIILGMNRKNLDIMFGFSLVLSAQMIIGIL